MDLFISDRERRQWLWVLFVLAWIYATLGPAYVLAAQLRNCDLLRVLFALLLVVAVIAWGWVKQHPGWYEIGVAIGVMAVYLWMIVRVESAEERTHLIEYSLVAILIYHTLIERRRNGRKVPFPAGLVIVVTALLVWLDEGVQSILPNRVYVIRDVGFNALAGLMAVVASQVLVRQKKTT